VTCRALQLVSLYWLVALALDAHRLTSLPISSTPTSSTASISFQSPVIVWSRWMITPFTGAAASSTSMLSTPGHSVPGSALSGTGMVPLPSANTSSMPVIAPGLYDW